MSASAPDAPAEAQTATAPDADMSILADVFSANASWSAAIHNAALKGQERAAFVWAERYLHLINTIQHALNTSAWDEVDTRIFTRISDIAASQGWLPGRAAEEVARYKDAHLDHDEILL